MVVLLGVDLEHVGLQVGGFDPLELEVEAGFDGGVLQGLDHAHVGVLHPCVLADNGDLQLGLERGLLELALSGADDA